MNEYHKIYKSFDNQKLLKIIEEAEKYQSEAIKAARFELSKREISEDEIQAFNNVISDRKSKIEGRQKFVKSIENKVKEVGSEIIETIGPIQKEPQNVDRKINAIVIAFSLIAIYHFIKKIGMIEFMLFDHRAEWDYSMVLYFLPIILLPIVLFLFWKRNKMGWILMSLYFVYSIINSIGMFFLLVKWKLENNDYGSPAGGFEIDFRDGYGFPEQNPMAYLFLIVIFGVTLWTICKKDVRDRFNFIR